MEVSIYSLTNHDKGIIASESRLKDLGLFTAVKSAKSYSYLYWRIAHIKLQTA